MGSIASYLIVRRLRWLGHVVRMKSHRLPRQLLFSWLGEKRPVGRPLKTYGHSIRDDLEVAYRKCKDDLRIIIRKIGWVGLALDRVKWYEFVKDSAT